MNYPKEIIPSNDNVFRNLTVAQVKDWEKPKRRPNEADFKLRTDEVGLSVNWDKYFNINDVYINIGLKKTKKDQTKYLDPRTFRVIKFNVGDIRDIKLIADTSADVEHKPINEPPNVNIAHSEICCDANSEDDEEFRLKICDLVASYPTPFVEPDFDIVNVELQKLRG